VDENDLRAALRDTVTIDAPPPMESSTVLAAARRSVRQRFAVATTGTVAAAALTVGWGLGPGSALFAADGATQAAGSGGYSTPGGWQSTTPTAGTPNTPTPRPTVTPTGAPWPGNTPSPQHSTATSGHHYEQGDLLLTGLRDALPAGFGAGSQTMNATTKDHGSTWDYIAAVEVTKDGDTGRLIAEVHTPGNGLSADPCTLAGQVWSQDGDCQVTTAGGVQVAVKTADNGFSVDQWVAYRHPDGTVVFIFQGLYNPGPQNHTPLGTLPFTATQLAALATDARFHLD
jgi:hypothetical protein